MRRKLARVLLLALVLLIATALPALAQGEPPGKLILGGSYTLASGERLQGDLGVIGGGAILQEGSLVAGDVLVAGGSLRAAGTIRGDIAIFGGVVDLASTARVEGDIVTFGGNVRRAPGAVVTGEIQVGPQFDIPGFDGAPRSPEMPPAPPRPSAFDWLLVQFLRLVRAVGVTVAMAALALVVAMFWPKGVETIAETALKQPVLAFAVGLLTLLLAGAAIVIMAITICLLPLALLLALVLIVAAALAWITVGWLLGRKLLELLKIRQTSLVMEASIGTLILVMGYFAVGIIPCVDFIFGLVVACLGIGAIVLTRFGTQPYEPGKGGRQSVPPTSPAPPARRELLAAPEAVPDDVIHLRGAVAPLTEAAIELPAAEVEPGARRSAEELGLPPAARKIVEKMDEQPPAESAPRPAGVRGSMGQPMPREVEEAAAAPGPTLRQGPAKETI